MFMGAWATAEPTFHRLCLGVDVSLILIDPPKLDAPPKILLRVIEYTIETEPEQKTYRLITSLLEPQLYPAVVIAREYHQRWEVENTIDELKTHLNGRKTPIRSLNPREVVQEVYGLL